MTQALRQLVLAVPFLFLLRCAPAPSPRSAVPPEAPAGRVVLISFDGVSGERLEGYLADPAKLPAGGFRRLAARGFHAVRSHPPIPSLTAVSHVTHVTGALPDETGVVSNVMRDFTKPFPATISGFAAPIRAETLWEAARRQGKRVGVMLYPGADGNGPARTADWMMTWPPDPIAPPRLLSLAGTDWRVSDPTAPAGDAPPRRTVIAFEKTAYSFALVALDGTPDGRVVYDRLRVVPATGEGPEVKVDEWFPVEVPNASGRTGAWCRVLALAPDLSKAEVYVGPLAQTTGTPREWVATLDSTLGFWPGTPDSDSFGADTARPELFLEQTERLADFLLRADLAAIARPDWDLLLLYRPEVDEVSHEFLLADPAQARFTPERSARFLGFVERSYALVDFSLDRIEKALRPNDSIFVTSDHGMTPLVAELSVNQVLHDAGLVTLDERGRISPASPTVAVTSSGIVHVHVNPTAGPDTLDRAEKAVRDFRLRGETLFDRIVRRDEAGELRLRAPESGDLIVVAKPGVAFASRVRKGGPVLAEPRSYGGHGYRNVYSDLDATFFAAGPGIPRARVETIGSWQIAARVARALGIEPPRGAAAP